ncbi:MAG: hypothetical protein QXD48_04050 [Candidatus Aenigmatarchaeota archaeon]
MKKIFFLLLIVLFIFSCSMPKIPCEAINGSKYRCSVYDYNSKCINLSVLKKGCTLEFVPGESIPPEATEKIVLKYKDIVKEIRSPDDFASLGCECIYIWNENQALEYLRFFSSYETFYLFDDWKIEIYPADKYENKDYGCYGFTIPKRLWNKLGLHDPIVEYKEEGFIITRFIIKPIPRPYMPTIFKETVLVERHGKISVLKEEVITSCEKYTEGLGFPNFI